MWLNCIPRSHGVQFPLAAVGCPFCPLLPPALAHTACPCLCFSSPSLCPSELPHLCLRLPALGFMSWGPPTGQVSYVLLLSPCHLHRFIWFLVFCVIGVLPCIGCKCVRIFYIGSQPREWKSWRWECFFSLVGHPLLGARGPSPPSLPVPAGIAAREELPVLPGCPVQGLYGTGLKGTITDELHRTVPHPGHGIGSAHSLSSYSVVFLHHFLAG